MTEPGGILLRKLSFVFSCVLIAAVLLLMAISAATIDTSSGFSSLGEAARENVSHFGESIGNGLSAVATTFDNIATLTNKATDLHAIIHPADYMEVPVIGALPPMQLVRAPAAQPVASITTPPPAPPAPAPAPPPAVNFSGANLYAAGNCTWWAAARRAETGHPIPNSWGNAASWARRATQDGYAVDHTPSTGAIMQTANSARGLGHVAFVESVDPDGTWHISEMNVIGLGAVDHKAMPPAAAASYNFIH